MAQIIKHRRGSLESVSSATKRAGELLVVTGSAGITATNGNTILFVGIDGSTVTPANKILQGTSVPNLSGASYDTSIDGIPYYDTSAQKMYILNKGGNVEIKASANTGGTGIVSGSSQVTELLPTGVVSGSSQVTISSTTGYTDFSSSLNSRLVTASTNITELYTTASDHETRIDSIESSIGGASGIGLRVTSLEAFTGSQETKNSTLATYTASVTNDLSAIRTFTASQESKDSTLGTYTGSIDTKFSTLGTYTGSIDTKLSTIGTYTASVSEDLTELFASASDHEVRIDGIQSYTSSLRNAFTASGTDVIFSNNVTIPGNLIVTGTTTAVNSTTIQLGDNIIELNGNGTANGGLLVKDPTSPNTLSGSLLWDSTNDYWKAGALNAESKILLAGGDGVISGSSQVTLSSTTGYSDFSSSLASKDTELFGTSSDHETRIDSIEASIGGASGIGQRVTALETFSGSQESKDSTLATYTGSVTTRFNTLATYTGSVDTNLTTLNSFSSSINTTIKTKLDVEGVISGSSQVNADSITNFDTNVKDKLNTDGVISGSSQLNNTTISGLKVTGGEISGSFSGSFQGDGSQLTGIASTLAFSGSTGNDTLNLKTEALLVTGSNSISAAVSNNTITITADNASTSAKGVASFSSTNFSVTSGNVSIKANGVTAATLNADVAGTGLSLDGVDNSLEVDYGSTAGTAVEGNTSLTIQGTSNEIEISGGSVTLGSGGTVTIGLPNSVTIPTASIQNNLSVGGNISVTGNLYVQGTTTTIDSTTVQIGDNIIELNGTGAANGGLLVRDVTASATTSGSLLWDSTNDYWKGGALGSEKEFARLNATPTSASVQVIGANGLLVDSDISDDGVKVTIGSDLIINGLTANTFVVSNGSKKLISVAPSNAGDLIQWNGSSFVASNEIDGGTF
jgi:spore maturation protein SpmB